MRFKKFASFVVLSSFILGSAGQGYPLAFSKGGKKQFLRVPSGVGSEEAKLEVLPSILTKADKDFINAVEEAQNKLPGDVQEQNLGFVVRVNEKDEKLYPISTKDRIMIGHIRGDRAAYLARGLQERLFEKLLGFIKFAKDFKGKFLLSEAVIADVPNTFFEILSKNNYKVVKISENEKKDHVTVNANGRRVTPFANESQIAIAMRPTSKEYMDTPAMRTQECGDETIKALDDESVDFILVNLLTSDMMKHTGSYESAVEGNESTDRQLGRIKANLDAQKQKYIELMKDVILDSETVIVTDYLVELLDKDYDEFLEELKKISGEESLEYVKIKQLEAKVPLFIVTADHGASEAGLIKGDQKKSDTFHTANPVPYIIYDPLRKKKIALKTGKTIINNAPTLLHLLGLNEQKPEEYVDSLLPEDYQGNRRRIAFAVLDGWGINPDQTYPGDAIRTAYVPNYNWLVKNASFTEVSAHGKVIGLRENLSLEEGRHHLRGLQAGQTDIGHFSLFTGRQIKQPLLYVDELIKGGIREGIFDETKPEVQMLVEELTAVKKENSSFHYIALGSEGGVHSSLYHLYALLRLAQKAGLRSDQFVIHLAADGRDVPSRTAHLYLQDVLTKTHEIGIGVVADVFGREMLVRKDGYEKKTYRIIDVLSGIKMDETLQGEPAVTRVVVEKSVTKVAANSRENIEQVKNLIVARLGQEYNNNVHHGLKHAEDLMERALILAKKLGKEDEIDWKVLTAAACLHDRNAEDEEHGEANSVFAKRLLPGILDQGQIEKVEQAIKFHGIRDDKGKKQREKAGIEAQILYDIDQWDAFGIKGIYRYIAIYSERNTPFHKILENVKKRYDTLTFDETKELAEQDYKISKSYFEVLNNNEYRAVWVINYILKFINESPDTIAVKALKSLGELKKETVEKYNTLPVEKKYKSDGNKLWEKVQEYQYAIDYFNRLRWEIVIPPTESKFFNAPVPVGKYGPHPTQEGLRPDYEKIARARRDAPAELLIEDIYAFEDQKEGDKAKPAISFGMRLKGGKVIAVAGVMGGISAGEAEPETHKSIDEAIRLFNEEFSKEFIGLNIARLDDITNKIIEIDNRRRAAAENKDKPLFSYIGSEISTGVSMEATLALAEFLHVPIEVVMNYRYNEYALNKGFSRGVRPITVPVNYSVVWEGGKHGAAKYLPELVKAGIISVEAAKKFPPRYLDEELIKAGDKSIMLAMVPPQEMQIMAFAATWEESRELGIKLTEKYQKLLKDHGINVEFGAESGATTKQTHTKPTKVNGNKELLINLELILDILRVAIDSLGEDGKKIRLAADNAASEMFIDDAGEGGKYYIGPSSAGNDTGLVTNEEFTAYKKKLFAKYPFISCEDWADEGEPEHWNDGRQIMNSYVQLGDDFVVSRADLIAKYTVDPNIKSIDDIVDRILDLYKASRGFDSPERLINAHLQKPNQSAEEAAMLYAVLTSHLLNNLVIFSHRGTRVATETYTANAAMAMGAFGGKWTLWGKARGALIAAMTSLVKDFKRRGVNIPYQGALFLSKDTGGPYYNHPVAQRLREEIPLTPGEQAEIDEQLSGKKESNLAQFFPAVIISPVILYLMNFAGGQSLAERLSAIDISAFLPALVEKMTTLDSANLLLLGLIPLALVLGDNTGFDGKKLLNQLWLDTHRGITAEDYQKLMKEKKQVPVSEKFSVVRYI
ncbi:MAG: hypothetical protein ABII74_03585 [Elusimicrobiota bacterium]